MKSNKILLVILAVANILIGFVFQNGYWLLGWLGIIALVLCFGDVLISKGIQFFRGKRLVWVDAEESKPTSQPKASKAEKTPTGVAKNESNATTETIEAIKAEATEAAQKGDFAKVEELKKKAEKLRKDAEADAQKRQEILSNIANW